MVPNKKDKPKTKFESELEKGLFMYFPGEDSMHLNDSKVSYQTVTRQSEMSHQRCDPLSQSMQLHSHDDAPVVKMLKPSHDQSLLNMSMTSIGGSSGSIL